jgi:type I restriction enzyme S subunit
MSQFETIIDPIYRKIHIALKQNQMLKKARDMLLSRLISGKLPVADLDIQFPPSMMTLYSREGGNKEPAHA